MAARGERTYSPQPGVSRAPPRVVIVGAGFGGLFATRALSRIGVEVTLVDRHNYHLFQPLLYQVAVAGLPPSDIAWPIRSILSRQKNATVLMGEVIGIDARAGRVELRDRQLRYDYLVVATGATHSYFGHEDWRLFAPGLKTIDDATLIRRRILQAFEQAEVTTSRERRDRLLRFVIVGGGPTGVDLAGTIAELAHHTLARDFRDIDPRDARIVLIEAGSRVLRAFGADMSAYAEAALRRLGVEVRTQSMVTACGGDGVVVADGERLPSATVIWAAGVAASPAAGWLGAPQDAAGRVLVEPDLSVPGLPNVFVVGDSASVKDALGEPVPGIAPAARQQGRYVAQVIAARIVQIPPRRQPRNHRPAGRGHRVPMAAISLRWLWEYATYGRGARLITGAEDAD